MSASTHLPVLKHHFDNLEQQHSAERLGMWMFLVTEVLFFSGLFVAVLGATAGFSQALAKHSQDAMIQRDVPEAVRTSAFARSETLLQVAWVLGGAIGIALPLNGALGMAVAAVVVALGTAMALRGLRTAPRHQQHGSSRPRVA